MLGDEFFEAVEAALAELGRHPEIGRELQWHKKQEPLVGLRGWALSPPFRAFRLFYRITPESVDVVRVLHGAEDIERALSAPSGKPERFG